MDSPSTIQGILDGFDSVDRPLAEVEIRSAIRPILTEPSDAESPAFAEFVAFSFVEERRIQANGCPFSPAFEQQVAGGGRAAFPTPEQVTPAMIVSWESRARSSRHPVMRARYAGLVWHFSKRVTGMRPSIEMARIAIDSTVDLAVRGLHSYPSDVIPKLRNARNLALSIRDDGRIEGVRDGIIEFEKTVSGDGTRGLWGISFDLLVREDRVRLDPSQYDLIISSLEAKLEAATNPAKGETFHLWDAKGAAMRLARHYRKKQRPDDLRRVLHRYGSAVLHGIEGQVAISASSMLRELCDTHREFDLRDDLPALEAKLRVVGEASVQEMKSFRHVMKIEKSKLRDHVQRVTTGTLGEVLDHIAAEYVPPTQMLAEHVKEISAAAPLQALMSQQIMDNSGRKVGEIGSVTDDPEGRLIQHLMQSVLPLQGVFMRAVMEEVLGRLKPTTEAILDHLLKSPVFSAETGNQLRRGIEAYLQGDNIVAVHLLLARVEGCARTLLRMCGGSITEPERNGSEMLRNLDKVLMDEKTVKVLTDDATFYLRAILCDPRGWNLRNDVYHGLASDSAYQQRVADVVFQAILMFGTLRAEAPASPDAPEAAPPEPESPSVDRPVM